MHSGKQAACCDPPVFAAPGGKMSVQVHHIVQKKKAMRKMLVANGVVKKEVCGQWYQFVCRCRFAVPRI